MDLKETTKRVQKYIETLKYKSFANKLEFLRFNSYHHHRPMSEVLQIFVQNPEARLLGSFDFWKDFSEESSVEFGQKSSVRIFDKQGKTKEVLYDLAQTTLKGDADLSLIPFREPVLSSELLFNTLVSLSGGSLTLDDYTSDKYFEESLAEIERFFEPYRESLTKFTKEEVDAALEVVRYNLYEEFGVYLSEEFDYSSIENSVTNTLQHFSHDRFLPVFSLANNISKELTNQVKEKYQEVELQLTEIKQDQQKFNEQMEELDIEVDFSAKEKVEKVKENTLGSSGILDKLEKAASDQGFYLWTRNENWTGDPEDDEGLQFLFDEGLYEAHAYEFKTVEELDEWLDNEEVLIVDGLGNHTTFVELNQFVQQEEQKILEFENNMSNTIYDFVARDSDLFEQVMHEPFGDIAVDIASNRDKITISRVDTETKELYTWFEMEKSTGIVLSQDKSFANISESQKRELLSHLKREYDAKFVRTNNISEPTPKIETHIQDSEANFPYKVGEVDKNTPAAIQVNWNETSGNDNFKFLNQSHDGEDISLEMLKAMIYDEVQLENNPETGYYKVSTTLDRIDIGDGFESNKELYQDIARGNNLEIDVQTYYDSIALEKRRTEQVKVPTTDDVSLLEQFPKAEERDELDPMEDFMAMLMSGEDELTIIVDDKDAYHHKISDSKDGQQIIFEMRQDKSTDTRYLVYENGKFIKNTFGDDIPDSRLINPIGLEDLEQRLEENKLKLQNQTEVSQQAQEISLFDSFEVDKEKPNVPAVAPSIVPTQPKSSFEFPLESQAISEFYPGTPGEKVKANLAAIRLAKKLSDENRLATVDEQKVLSRYVGWGGLANNFFDESNPRYSDLREELKTLVTEHEYSNMLQSSLTAYYTSPEVILAMYSHLNNLGFNGGRVLDPSMGTGNFFASMPGNLKNNSDLFGVELDAITGQIATNLQQTSQVQIKGFQDTNFNDNALDLVTTNVPFGQIMIGDEKYSRNYAIHDYFIKKSLDLVHEGGFVAVITSTATMDKTDSRFREEISKQANLVSVVRLPNDAFKNIAGTDVSSDILIFQKTSTSERKPDWINTHNLNDNLGNRVSINRYFHEHPEFVLGQVGIKTFNGGVLTVKRDFEEEQYIPKLTEALEKQSDASYYSHNKSEELIESFGAEEYSLPREILEAQEPFTLFVYKGKPYFYDGKHVIPHYKQSSVTLNKDETRKRQLERFEKVQDRIFDTKVKYKTVYSQIGYFDTWSNFIPTGVGSAFNLQDIPSDVLEKLNKETESVTKGDYRYTIIPEKEQLTLKIEEVVNRQYLYNVVYSKKEVNAIEKMIDLRYSLQDLLNIQHKLGYTKVEYEQLRISFNEKYDEFVEQYGYISDSSNRQIMREDDYYPFLASVEEEAEDEITKEPILTKSAVFFEPTIQPEQKIVKVETAHDALLASLNRKGHLDFEYMSDIYGKTEDEMIAELGDRIYYVGDGEYVTSEDFLSGDVKTKLVEAENNQEFNHEDRDWTKNIKALQEVIPEDLLLSDITFKFGTRFIPLPVYEKFLSEIMNTKAKVIYDKPSDSYKVMVADTHKLAVTDTYGYKGYNGEKLATALLNQREAKIYKPDADNPTKRVLDERGTAIMEDKANLLKDNFRSWVLTNPEASEQIVDVYNDKFNRYVTKGYDGQSFTVKGLAKQYTLRPHQKNAAMRIVQDERAGLAHEVGSGKTLTMLASCMKLQELGVVNKPLFVIPKPLIMQFAKEIYKYFPESKVLVARTEDFKKENRKRFISRIANGSYDAIVIADSQFEKVSMSKAYQANYLRNQLFEAREQLSKMDQDNKYTVKRTEKAIEGLEARIVKLQKQDTDTFINFEDLGIDMLYVDEAHGYKNLAPFSQLENVKGISTTRSQKAMDMQQKVEYLQSIYNNKRVVFSTGTPMSNSVVELYTMTKFIAPDVLEQFGISSFDTWVSSFGIIENNFELTAAGAYKINRRFTKFGNVPELINTFRSTWDIQTQDMLDLPVPEVEIISHESEVTEAQDKFIDSLLARAEAIEEGTVKPFEDNMLKIVGESKKAALDMRTLDDVTFTNSDSDKISQVVASVTKIYFDTQEEKSTQAIFCDQSIPVKYRNGTSKNPDHTINNFSAYDEIKRQLVANGIPAEEISFIHDTTDKTKDALMKDMRTGKRRILLGSTSKAGTGLNIQDKLIAVHHVDLPWRPSDLTQRNGRIIRQGNENDKVQVHYYITKGSMDAYLWQTLENKAKVINQIMLGDTKIREMDELSNDQINMAKFKAIAEADPVRQEYMETEMKLQSLERSRERFFDSQISNVKRVKREKERLPMFEERLELITADLKEVEATENNSFSITVHYKGNERAFTDDDKKTEVAEFIAKQINNNTLAYNFAKATGANDTKITHIATYRNFQILHNPALGDGEKERLILKGEAQYSFWVNPSAPLGILTRLDGLFEKGISRDYLNTSEEISQIKSSINYIESNKDSTFPKEKEYQEVKSRCAELRDALENKKELTKNNQENEKSLNI
ncbi:SNF2-related protein [Lactococcus garvieae]|uniref:SNF2-related protein n=1 Tax=Lactococcus garvieae TaxID=1363 RepID=UPI00254A6ADC|nr:SNF2-related protein [Lactococcus garvieae]